MRENSFSADRCVRNRPLGDKDEILLSPIQVTLGLMEKKNIFKNMNKYGKGFEQLTEKFRKLRDGKLKEGIFIGPQIREILSVCAAVDGN
jgi:hypothetical protein